MNSINMTEKGGEAWAAGRLSDAPTNWSSNKIIQQTKAGSRVSLAKAAAVAAATAAEAVEAAVAAAAALAEAEAEAKATDAAVAAAAEAVEEAPNWLSNVFYSQSRAGAPEEVAREAPVAAATMARYANGEGDRFGGDVEGGGGGGGGGVGEENEEGGGGGSASAVAVKVTIFTNSPIYNKYISGYIRGETGYSIQDTASITFSAGSIAAYFDVQLANFYQRLEFEIIVTKDLKFNYFMFGNDYEKDGRVTYTTKTNNVIRAIVTPYEIDGELDPIFAELEISLSNEIVVTPDELITQTVTKSVFELVESGLTLCQIEVLKKERLNEILNNIENLRNYSRNSGISTNNNNGSLNQAGSRYSENFPSAKFANNVGINELLLTKKNYMFSNSLNKNVISGSIGFNSSNSSPYIAGSSSGLTKVQQYANAAKGRSPSGGVGRRYGVQFFDGRSLVSIPNIYDRFNRSNQTINLCALGNETTN